MTILSDELKPDFPKKLDDKSGFEYESQVMSDEEIESIISEFSSCSDIDNAIQNMALTIKYLAAKIETGEPALSTGQKHD